MEPSVYSATAYKPFLQLRLKELGHGSRKRLAEAMGCQLAYVSHVLNGDRHLSVDQAEAAARFLELDADQLEYFIWLVELERAGTPGTRRFFQRLLERKRSQYLELSRRVDITDELGDADKAIYYSSHLYAAVHMMVTIPELRTPEAIARRLGQPLARVQDILKFLKTRGLVKELRGKLEPGSTYLFVGRGSPFVAQHHANWRLQALQSAARRSEENLHLSMVVTLSEKDARALKARIASFVEELSDTIKVSREERLMGLNLDFFEV